MGNLWSRHRTKYNDLHQHDVAIVDFEDICKRYQKARRDVAVENKFISVITTTRNLICHVRLGKQNEEVMKKIAVNMYAIYGLVGLDMRRKIRFRNSFTDDINQYDQDNGVCYVSRKHWMDLNWRRSTETLPKAQLQAGFDQLDDQLKYCFWVCVMALVAKKDGRWTTAVNRWKNENYPAWTLYADKTELEELIFGTYVCTIVICSWRKT